LRYLEDRGADLVAVTDADLVVAESVDGEVLAELPVYEIASSESPSMLSRRTRREPVTGSLKTPVKTVRPCQGTSFGMPTLTDSNLPTAWAAAGADSACWAFELMLTPFLWSSGLTIER